LQCQIILNFRRLFLFFLIKKRAKPSFGGLYQVVLLTTTLFTHTTGLILLRIYLLKDA
jgi:hypothetical protein